MYFFQRAVLSGQVRAPSVSEHLKGSFSSTDRKGNDCTIHLQEESRAVLVEVVVPDEKVMLH